MTSIFLSADLAMIEEADLIEDKNQEDQNNKDTLYPEIIGFVIELGQPHNRME
ncbi:MAG TPA: hypothetical protein VE912_17180 [Bacteroidales bacterium]|nr:hypothetical protein [Bacteroidales bacterium]